MKRHSVLKTKLEDISDSFSTGVPNSNNLYREEVGSPHSHETDSESIISENSKKIRKKRDTYQKISDDIRVKLLDAVQNGETLKATAKRYKINYSSAKSILHTYRKEGRILKKSAQERTTKKKIVATKENPEKNVKTNKVSKKENVKPTHNSSEISQSLTLLTEKAKGQTLGNISLDKNSQGSALKALNGNFSGGQQENNSENKTLTENSIFQIDHHNLHRDEEPTKMLTMMDHGEMSEMNHMGHFESLNSGHRFKVFENFRHMNHFDPHSLDNGGDHMLGEGHEFMNHSVFTREFDGYNDMMQGLYNKSNQNDEYYHDSGFYLRPRGLSFGDNMTKMDNMMDYEDIPLKSFMDTQKVLREALRKASISSFNGSIPGFRKDSIDLMF
jgi:hypothetical protein